MLLSALPVLVVPKSRRDLILKCSFKICDRKTWTELISLRIKTSGGDEHGYDLGFHKVLACS
jgi:hypothetical protein